jgi:hypothetical protein
LSCICVFLNFFGRLAFARAFIIPEHRSHACLFIPRRIGMSDTNQSKNWLAVASKKWKSAEEADPVLQLLKNSRARHVCLPAEYVSRCDVMKTLAKNRAITSLDLEKSQVCMRRAELYKPTGVASW